MKKAILYTRVEKRKSKRNADELVRQETELRAYCKKYDLEVVKVIQDYASGKDFNRVEFSSLWLDLLNRKIQVDYFLFTNVYVFCENVAEVIRVTQNLLELSVTVKAIQNDNIFFAGVKKI